MTTQNTAALPHNFIGTDIQKPPAYLFLLGVACDAHTGRTHLVYWVAAEERHKDRGSWFAKSYEDAAEMAKCMMHKHAKISESFMPIGATPFLMGTGFSPSADFEVRTSRPPADA